MVRCPAVLRGSRAALAPQDDGRASNHEGEEPIIALVIARAETGAIGRGGDLPWRLGTDLKQFRKVTLGKPVLMGRLTFKSLGRPLDHRANIVLSRDPGFSAPGAQVAGSLEEGLELARAAARKAGVDEIMVIGGDDVFRAVMPRAGRIYLTEVHASPHADVFLREFDLAGFREVSRERHEPGPRDEYPFSFVLLERKRGA
jgi:dihydrofolate reductase